MDFRDFSQLARYLNMVETSADVAPLPFGDGIVDFRDVAMLLEHWLADSTP